MFILVDKCQLGPVDILVTIIFEAHYENRSIVAFFFFIVCVFLQFIDKK